MQTKKRQVKIERATSETKIKLTLDLDGASSEKNSGKIDTGVEFLNHMLEQLAKHGAMNLDISCHGDTQIDDHHSVEDIGICLGQAVDKALGDKRGIARFATAYAPLDEALSRTVIDVSGRPGLFMLCRWTSSRIGSFDTQLVREFFQGFVNGGKLTLHLDCLRGINCHHQVESMFKSFALALKSAVRQTSNKSVPSTKGVL